MCHTCAACYSRVGIYGLPVLAEVAPFKGGVDVYTTCSFLSLERQSIPRDRIPSIFLFRTVYTGDSETLMGLHKLENADSKKCTQEVHAQKFTDPWEFLFQHFNCDSFLSQAV